MLNIPWFLRNMMSGDAWDGTYFLPFGAERLPGQASQCTAPGGAESETAIAATTQWRGATAVQPGNEHHNT